VGHTIALAAVNLVLLDPDVQGLRHAADLGGNGLDGCPLRRMLAAVLLNHAHGALAHLGGKLR
jgi:hypothetical protein